MKANITDNLRPTNQVFHTSLLGKLMLIFIEIMPIFHAIEKQHFRRFEANL